MEEPNKTLGEILGSHSGVRWLSSGMLHNVVWKILTDISEELAALIIITHCPDDEGFSRRMLLH
jgi:hypothetical protein